MSLTTLAPGAWRVDVNQPIRYDVRFVDDVLDQTFPEPVASPHHPDPLGRTASGSPRRLVIVDHNVNRIYGSRIDAFLRRHDIEPRIVTIPGGEATKTMRTALRLCEVFDDFGVPRFGEPLVAFVSGVGSDVLGFAASIYRRGVPRIEYPTSGVAAVDAAIGAKTAVDHNDWKNRLGSYRPPEQVVIDPRFLATIGRRRLSDALAEMLKVAIAVDSHLFYLLELHGRLVLDEAFQGRTALGKQAATDILHASVGGTLGELEPNLLEDDAARALYLGHTWSPKVEMTALKHSQRLLRRRRSLLHGEAVALDVLLSAGIALDRGHIAPSHYERIAAAIVALELPTWDPLLADTSLLLAGGHDSRRHRGGRLLAPLPSGIGGIIYTDDVDGAALTRAAARQRALGGRSLA